MALDPKGKYLIQEGSGHVYIWSEKLAKRKDMRAYDPVKKGLELEPTSREARVPIELQGRSFMVEQALHDVLTEMGGVLVKLQEENKAMKEKVAYFEGFKERLETDNLDLQQQLEVAKTELAQFTKVEEAQPEKKGKK